MARILIVEDDPVSADSMLELLEIAGHHVLGIANNGFSAVKQVARKRPDLALIDIKLGETGDGVRIALHLKDRYPVKIVFVSGYLDNHTQRRAAAADPAGFVAKPVAAEQLLKIVSIATAGAFIP
jgi:two-component system, response regulator PdtaR